LAAHRDGVVGSWFSHDGEEIYSVSKDGACFVWRIENSQEKDGDVEMEHRGALSIKYQIGQSTIRLVSKHYFNQKSEFGPARVKSAEFHPASSLLVVGFSSGVFGLYELPAINSIHSLRCANNNLITVIINYNDVLAFHNVKSTRFPFRLRENGWRLRQVNSASC
jgi:periodic tryptophan protein 2